MNNLLRFTLANCLLLLSTAALAEVAFLATADCQYENGNNDRKNASDGSFQIMFEHFVQDTKLNGILIAGDLTQNSRRDEFEWYTAGISDYADYVFEGLGNHDVEQPNFFQSLACIFGLGSCVYPDVIESYIVEKDRSVELLNVQKPHYSWQWEDFVFIQLNIFPGNEPAPQFASISPKNSLDYLAETLASEVEGTNKRVVLVHHYGFDPFSRGVYGEAWWTEAQRQAYWELISPYSVAAIITGHVHLTPNSNNWYIP